MTDNTSQTPAQLVSIAMATYNGYTHLPEQLQSIFAQSHTTWELIIVDDCSTDNTQKLLENYQQQDSRIKIFFNEKNVGYKETFYKALTHCTGKFVLFCDQDDVWLPHKITTLLNTIGSNLLVFSDSELVDASGASMQVKLSDTVRMLQAGDAVLNRGFVIGNCVWGHTIMFHTSLYKYIGQQDQDHPHDWWFAVVSSLLKKIVYCPQVLNHYRQHGANVTQAIPTGKGMVKGRKKSEYELQLSRMGAMAALPFNTDKKFYLRWANLFLQRKRGFSMALFLFLLQHRKGVFSFKRKGSLSQLIEIRKMCRQV